MPVTTIVKSYLELFLKQHHRLPNIGEAVDAMMTYPNNLYNVLAHQFPRDSHENLRECSRHLFSMCGYLPRLHYIRLAVHFRQLHKRLPSMEEMVTMHQASQSAENESLHTKTVQTKLPIDIALIKHRIEFDTCRSENLYCSTCQYTIEPGQDLAILPCKHTFHSHECIDPWIQDHNDCPNCRCKIYKSEDTHQAVNLLNSCAKFHDMYREAAC